MDSYIQERDDVHLSEIEKAACRQMNVMENEFLAAKAARMGRAAFSIEALTSQTLRGTIDGIGRFYASWNAGYLRAALGSLAAAIERTARSWLEADDFVMASRMCIGLAQFAVVKRRCLSGNPAILASDYVDDAALNAELEPADHMKNAMAAIAAFLKDPDHLESLQHLLRADTAIGEAIKKVAAGRRAAGGY
jgi:hypothetical protein